jgi:hypothetical protein
MARYQGKGGKERKTERPRATELSAAEINSSAVDGVQIWGERNQQLGTEAKFPAEWRPITVWLMASERGAMSTVELVTD